MLSARSPCQHGWISIFTNPWLLLDLVQGQALLGVLDKQAADELLQQNMVAG